MACQAAHIRPKPSLHFGLRMWGSSACLHASDIMQTRHFSGGKWFATIGKCWAAIDMSDAVSLLCLNPFDQISSFALGALTAHYKMACQAAHIRPKPSLHFGLRMWGSSACLHASDIMQTRQFSGGKWFATIRKCWAAIDTSDAVSLLCLNPFNQISSFAFSWRNRDSKLVEEFILICWDVLRPLMNDKFTNNRLQRNMAAY